MTMTPNMETIQKNLLDWQKGRADAAAAKVERLRKKRVRQERRAFENGFNSLAECFLN